MGSKWWLLPRDLRYMSLKWTFVLNITNVQILDLATLNTHLFDMGLTDNTCPR
jgi:hypothetical protein